MKLDLGEPVELWEEEGAHLRSRIRNAETALFADRLVDRLVAYLDTSLSASIAHGLCTSLVRHMQNHS